MLSPRAPCLLAACVALAAVSCVAAEQETTFGVFPGDCFEKLVMQQQLADLVCLKKVVSKLLGYAIITGAFALKVPQILNILAAKDATGLSPSAFYMETVAFAATVAYNLLQANPFSTYGEAVIILVQNVALVILLWVYMDAEERPSAATRAVLSLGFVGLLVGMFALPPELQTLLPTVSIASGITSRLPQIWTNFRNGHTGQMAVVTWVLNLAGGLARVFTTLQEVDDALILASFVIGAALSAVIVAQILWYWTATAKVLAERQAARDKRAGDEAQEAVPAHAVHAEDRDAATTVRRRRRED